MTKFNIFKTSTIVCFIGSLFLLSIANPLLANNTNTLTKIVEERISGTIKDSKGEAIVGANVAVKGTNRIAVTDADGRFTLEANAGETIMISFVGYKSQEIKVGTATTLDIILVEDESLIGEVAVIGTRGKPRTDVDRPVPVDVLNAKELRSTGQIDLGQQVQYSSPSFNSSKNGINGVANYADPASLRGMGGDQVLVLINGKRRHQFSALNLNVTVGKGTVVTDLNTIPSLALERVEILRDGAAAMYGSDAIAGVVNLGLRKTTGQGSFTTQYGQTKAGDGGGVTSAINYGFKLGKEGSYLNLTANYLAAAGTDRSDPYNGNIYNATAKKEDSIRVARGVYPAKGAGDFKVTEYGSNKIKSGQAFYNFGYPVGKNWNLYSFGGYSQKNIEAFGFFRVATPTNANSNPDIHPDGYTPSLPGVTVDMSSVVGLERKLEGGWNMDFSTGYGKNYLDLNANNTSNPSMGATSPKDFYVGRSAFAQSTTEANISKNFANLLGTESFNLAFGAQYRKDFFQLTKGDENSYKVGPLAATKGKAPGSSGRPGIAPEDEQDATRSNIGVYADVETDITKRILVAAALRFENYSDFGNNVSGKLAARFKITESIALRGSINKGFRAPNLQQLYNSVTTSTVQAGVIKQTKQYPSNEPRLKQIGIEDPKAETSWNYSAGVTAKAGERFLFTLDAYQIDIKNRIIICEPLNVANTAALKPLFPGIQEISFFTNHLNTKTKGVDFVTSYKQPIGKSTLTASVALTVNETKISSQKATPAALQAGTAKAILIIDTVSIALIETSLPRQKVLASLNYNWNQKLNVLLRANHFGGVTAAEKPAGKAHIFQSFAAKTLIDASVSYNFTPKLQFTIGANNLTDVYPDKVLNTLASYFNGQTPYTRNANQFGFNGAYYYANVQFTF